jgi:NTP pyrophosphatase (non-canonical NTP hydrolase)
MMTPGEAELLHLVIEEMGEAIQAASKALRFGYDNTDPSNPMGPNNRQKLEMELGDVRAATILLCEAGDLQKDVIHSFAGLKLANIGMWLRHQEER